MENVVRSTMSEAEYLALEAASDVRHEYSNGEVVAMAGTDPLHGQLVTTIVQALGRRLAGRACFIWAENQRVRVEHTGLYVYPDVVVACGRPRFDGPNPADAPEPDGDHRGPLGLDGGA